MSSATTLLAHFHLGLQGQTPFKLALNGRFEETAASTILTQDDISLVVRSSRRAERNSMLDPSPVLAWAV